MTKETEAKWVERIREWRASGLSAEEFATSKGFKSSTLSWAASLLGRSSKASAPPPPNSEPSEARPRTKRRRAGASQTPRFLPVHARPTSATAAEMIVEIGFARIRVHRGFDVSLLGEVVRALGGLAQ
jgi:hypothetical protein